MIDNNFISNVFLINNKQGNFEGDVYTKWNSGKSEKVDRVMVLTEQFTFTDKEGEKWIAKQGNPINGASIPAIFWGKLGLSSPYIGNYRRATALHDSLYYDHHHGELGSQDDRVRVDRVMYEAMKVDNTAWYIRKAIYFAVYFFGSSYWDVEKPVEEFDDEMKEIYNAAIDEAGDEPDEFYDIDGAIQGGTKIYGGLDAEISNLTRIAEKHKSWE